MNANQSLSLLDHFADLPDPRLERTRRHELLDLISITFCAVISGSENWVAVATYAECKRDWLQTFLSLPHGIPSHDTFNRFFNRLDPLAFQSCFASWMQGLQHSLGLKQIPIDGKTLRHSFDKAKGKNALHLVSAWCRENGLTLGQVAVEGKSNEITAIPRLLEILDLAGALVTIDAMGCQKDIAAQIIDEGGDYLLTVKDNQPRLHEDVQQCMENALEEGTLDDNCFFFSEEKGHGRLEKRYCCVTTDLDTLRDRDFWKGVKVVCQIVRERILPDGQYSSETHYYIGSRVMNAVDYAKAIRGHWSIENQCHWTLDVAFREDDCRCRTGHGPENLAWIRRMALGLLKQNTSEKIGIENKRRKAGWDNDFLLELLGVNTPE